MSISRNITPRSFSNAPSVKFGSNSISDSNARVFPKLSVGQSAEYTVRSFQVHALSSAPKHRGIGRNAFFAASAGPYKRHMLREVRYSAAAHCPLVNAPRANQYRNTGRRKAPAANMPYFKPVFKAHIGAVYFRENIHQSARSSADGVKSLLMEFDTDEAGK